MEQLEEESPMPQKVKDVKREVPMSIGLDDQRVVWSSTHRAISPELCLEFETNGFVILKNVLDEPLVHALNERLEFILRGEYDRDCPPDKQPRLLKTKHPTESRAEIGDIAQESISNSNKCKPLGFSGNFQNVKVLQVINIHKCDALFRSFAECALLGELVSKLANWRHGARLAQDQVWAKPPGAAGLVFHRDSPYFMFDPPKVVTVWVALDDMDSQVGPLEYVVGSHEWGDGRVGSSNQFFESNVLALLNSAAEREGLSTEELQFVSTSGLLAGGISIHNGLTWHGSQRNISRTKPRRGLGLHFIPAEARFTSDAQHSRIWKRYVEHGVEASLPEDDFPITWEPPS